MNRDKLNNIVERNILVYGNFHIIYKNAYIFLLNEHYDNLESTFNNFLLNESIISDISNLDFNYNLPFIETEIYNLFLSI